MFGGRRQVFDYCQQSTQVTVAMHACRLTGTSSRVIGSNCRGAIAPGALRFESPPEAPGSSLHPNVAVEGMVASCNCNCN